MASEYRMRRFESDYNWVDYTDKPWHEIIPFCSQLQGKDRSLRFLCQKMFAFPPQSCLQPYPDITRNLVVKQLELMIQKKPKNHHAHNLIICYLIVHKKQQTNNQWTNIRWNKTEHTSELTVDLVATKIVLFPWASSTMLKKPIHSSVADVSAEVSLFRSNISLTPPGM